MDLQLVNQTGVREAAKPYRLSHDFCAALDRRMLVALEEAKRRAEANGRTTLMPHDL